jgi:hypothetical protein
MNAATTITLPQTNTTELNKVLDFKKLLGNFSWTGNNGGERFHFTFKTTAEFKAAKKLLKSI